MNVLQKRYIFKFLFFTKIKSINTGEKNYIENFNPTPMCACRSAVVPGKLIPGVLVCVYQYPVRWCLCVVSILSVSLALWLSDLSGLSTAPFKQSSGETAA